MSGRLLMIILVSLELIECLRGRGKPTDRGRVVVRHHRHQDIAQTFVGIEGRPFVNVRGRETVIL